MDANTVSRRNMLAAQADPMMTVTVFCIPFIYVSPKTPVEIVTTVGFLRDFVYSSFRKYSNAAMLLS